MKLLSLVATAGIITSTQGAAVSPTVSSTSNTSGAPGSYGLVNGVEFVVMIGMMMSLATIW